MNSWPSSYRGNQALGLIHQFLGLLFIPSIQEEWASFLVADHLIYWIPVLEYGIPAGPLTNMLSVTLQVCQGLSSQRPESDRQGVSGTSGASVRPSGRRNSYI